VSRSTIPAWASTARPGFGYRAGELADVAEHFIEQSDLRDLTVMVQDWGGPIGLAAAVRHPTRYRGLIIGNTWAWPARGARSRLVHGLFSTLWGGPIGRLAIERANAFTRLILPAGHRRTTLTSAEMAQYLGPYPDPDSRRPCHTLPREITQARTFLTQLESELDVLAALPALILWADRDFAFKSPDLTRWQNLLPRQHTHILHGAGHFLQDDAAEEVCDVIRAWKPA
jgi:haloalkane dehalogenase